MITLVARSKERIIKNGQVLSPFVPVQRSGRLYDINGDTIELFSIRILALATHHSIETVKKWHRVGFLPQPLFRVWGSRWRWYFGAQLVNVNRLTRKHLHGRARFASSAEYGPFFADVRRIWYEPDVVVKVCSESSADAERVTQFRPSAERPA